MKNSIAWILCCLAFLALWSFAGSDLEVALEGDRLYCEMVEQHNITGGAYGWPDYKSTFKHCEVSK
jgi:hypothetical protein